MILLFWNVQGISNVDTKIALRNFHRPLLIFIAESMMSFGSLVPWLLRNRWHNARGLGVQVISSHIFREGNSCVDKLAEMGHVIQGSIWFDTLPAELHMYFYLDKTGLPNYRFP